ncbi:MAG: ABC transporter substrate-binding protein, partial [Candidatus Sungbacteria bacterium]|nr:ABC transporter substrate-binding protein [Candidatus Sungbacteria bacterium]
MMLPVRLKKIFTQFRIFRLHKNGTRFAIRKLLYLPRIISSLEKRYLFLLGIIVFLSGIGLVTRLYTQLTVPMPKVAWSYTEGVIGEPRAINPLYASRDTDRDISRLIFSGLLTYDGSGAIEPDLAERIETSDDNKIYTVVLKKELTWHDGEPITADDIVFTIHTIQNAQYRSPLRSNWQGVNVEKLDNQSVRFILRAPYAPFVENLTLGIIPKHIWQNVSPEQAPLHEANLKPVGSGPYRFDEMKQNKDGSLSWYQIVRNPDYHREGPFIKKIIFQFYKSEDEMFTAWRKGIIDGYGGISPARLSDINPDKSLVL